MQMQTKEINTSFFTTDRGVGGPGGSDFFIGIKEGANEPISSTVIVRSLKAWYNTIGTSKTFTGIQVRLTDGTVKLAGKENPDQETDEFYFAEGENVASLKIWYNSFGGGRCGKVELVTSQNRTFIIDAPTTSGDNYYEPEIGSGVLFGVFGNHGTQMDCLGFPCFVEYRVQF